MYTVDNALDSLQKYDISQDDLLKWERALGLDIPVDNRGQKIYSPHHLNLFKNVKKHITLGRTLEQIKNIISLPPNSDAMPENNPTAQPSTLVDDRNQRARQEKQSVFDSAPTSAVNPALHSEVIPQTEVIPSGQRKPLTTKSQYASFPQRAKPTSQAAATVVELVSKLTAEKDHLYQKLLETEKLNSHLYSANNLYHRRVKELDQNIQQLRAQLHLDENIKLLEDKDRLQKQLIEFEKANQERESELKRTLHEKDNEIKALAKAKEADVRYLIQDRETLLKQFNVDREEAQKKVEALEHRIEQLTQPFDASVFCGDWMETGQLSEIVYDNFGVNIEAERVRLFRISKKPERIFGNTAMITTTYQYETNSQWKREETLVAAWTEAQTLEGEVTAEYILDGVPVAKAIYQVSCKRNV